MASKLIKFCWVQPHGKIFGRGTLIKSYLPSPTSATRLGMSDKEDLRIISIISSTEQQTQYLSSTTLFGNLWKIQEEISAIHGINNKVLQIKDNLVSRLFLNSDWLISWLLLCDSLTDDRVGVVPIQSGSSIIKIETNRNCQKNSLV